MSSTESPSQEGILTVLVSMASYFLICNYPATAKWLSDSERSYIHARLKEDSDATQDESFTWQNVSKALKDPKCWLYGLGFHTMSLPLYTLSLFLPTIIKELGYTAAQAQLMTVPPYAIACTLTIAVAVFVQRTGRRAPFIMATSSLGAIGYILLLTDTKAGVSYFGTILATGGIYPSVAMVLAWPANNVSGQTKRATANAMQISIGNLGAVIGTQLYRATDGPRFFLGHGFALGYLCLNVLVVGVLWVVLSRENARRERVVREGGVGGGDGDEDLLWRFEF